MPRKPATVEFLEKLVEWSGGQKGFCQKTNTKQPNLSAYLNSQKKVSWDWLKGKCEQIWRAVPIIHPLFEGEKLEYLKKGRSVKASLECEGVYALFDSGMRVLYFGKASNLKNEIEQTLNRKVNGVKFLTGNKNLTFRDITAYVSAYEIVQGDAELRHDIEALVLRVFVNNTFNKNAGKFKGTKQS